jgi:hypothetical protein
MAGKQPSHPIRITVQKAKHRYDQGNLTILEVVIARSLHGFSRAEELK